MSKPSVPRLIYDKVYVNVYGLQFLGVKAEGYGSFLIPMIMSILPRIVRLQMVRVTTKDGWEISELLKVINAEAGFEIYGRPFVRNDWNLTLTTQSRKMVAHWTTIFQAANLVDMILSPRKSISVRDICKRKGTILQPAYLLLNNSYTPLLVFVFTVILFVFYR